MNSRCRVLPFESADGPANMALDEALLDAVIEDGGSSVFRTYGWTVPTLSLGYFQRMTEAEADPRWREVPMVRRPTGGGAIWHHSELTYLIVLPASHSLARRAVELYRAVHEAIATGLRSRGVSAGRRGASNLKNAGPRPFLCFTDRDDEDIVAQGSKIVGSSQRRRSGAILQHGSLLLSRSALTPELPGASDLAPLPADLLSWARLLEAWVPKALGLHAERSVVSNAERTRALVLERSTYRDPSWTQKR